MEFPELVVRADVVVRGPRLDEALGQLAGLLAADLADLDAVPVFFVQGLQLVEPLSECGQLQQVGRSLYAGLATCRHDATLVFIAEQEGSTWRCCCQHHPDLTTDTRQ
jgi:hypothetical protein